MQPSDLRDRLAAALARQSGPTSDAELGGPPLAPRGGTLREAGVLVAFDETGCLYLTKRASHLSQHPGQIAFPGGKIEAVDDGPAGCALREAAEEIALPSGAVEILGLLPPHVTGTGFRMTPVLARITKGFEPVPEPGEVAEVFRVPFAHVADLSRYRIESRAWRGTRRHYYVVPWGPYYIWGATAMILHGLAGRLS